MNEDDDYINWLYSNKPVQDEYMIDELDNPENQIEWHKLIDDIYFN